ncbi:MAG: efflux RND transporter periplasmic adaptor subunit [Kiritimatiellia bacterium]
MTEPDRSSDTLTEEIVALGGFDGPPAEFWRRLLALLGSMSGAESALLLRSSAATPEWRLLLTWPQPSLAPAQIQNWFGPDLQDFAARAFEAGSTTGWADARPAGPRRIALRMDVSDAGQRVVAVLRCPPGAQSEEDLLRDLHVAATLPALFQKNRAARQARGEADAYREVLETVTAVFGRDRFMASCLTFCNELANRFECDQASLGFLIDKRYVRLAAISQTARFDKKSSVVQALEALMEEAADQQQEILWPAPGGEGAFISRQSEAYARLRGLSQVLAVPMRLKNEVVAVVCCERAAGSFTPEQVRQVHLAAELVAGRLMDVRRLDRWLPLRWGAGVKRVLAGWVGVEHTLAKTAGILFAAFLLTLLFGRGNYRVEAPFTVKADRTAELSAPIEGFIGKVGYELGQPVKQGQVLIEFDQRALTMERLAALADINRYEREVEKRMAENRLADMRINQALLEQSRARLKLVDYQLEQSVIRAPFDGYVVEGEWQDKIDAAVRQGEKLVTVTRLDSLYAELEVESLDIAQLQDGMTGRIAFASDPRTRFAVKLTRVNPAAIPRSTGPVFLSRVDFQVPAQPWWRPGMSGVARLDAGRRPLWWIFLHRTIDVLRLRLWW